MASVDYSESLITRFEQNIPLILLLKYGSCVARYTWMMMLYKHPSEASKCSISLEDLSRPLKRVSRQYEFD